jgi:putative heme-binding domain-containing protein
MPVVSKYSRVSPAGIGRYRNTVLGDDFKDNLFSAQFNTHRIIRHKLIREGGSFRTEDQTFFSSRDEDFHPTDVLEDADGSLLVVETGGWFIKGCPLSQVSKPELKGAIYRVRRTGARKTEDAYGNAIGWASMEAAKAVSYLEDARPFVRDRTVQQLVDKGAVSVAPLTDVLKKSRSADVRTKALFALYRIGTPEAMSAVRGGLSDADVQVRVAAARSLGLAKDQGAVSKLMELVRKDDLAVRRQAATALGQIGDKSAVPALLAAAEGIKDRFVQHAIIYSLITLNQPGMVEPALVHTSPDVREAALIALDQMPKSPLRSGQLTPFLASDNSGLRRTALWVASHHPEWSGDMIAFLRNRFNGPALSEEETQQFGELLVNFCGNAGMQQFIAGQLKNAAPERKLFLLNAMAECREKKFPEVWVAALGGQLASGNDGQVKARALELVRLREITSLAGQLRQLADDDKNIARLRMEAIAALLKVQPSFSDKHFTYLYNQLAKENEAPARQQAATVLAGGKLSDEQLMKIAREYLPQADAFILPRLLPVFEGNTSGQIGKTLAATLMKSPSLDSFNEENVQTMFTSYPAEVKPDVEKLMAKLHEVRAGRLERMKAMESQIASGDLERGRVLFYGKAICATCHKVGAEGGNLGPDLTSIQKDRSAHDLLEAVVYPSASFVREYETYKIKTQSGEHTGVIQKQLPDAIILGTAPQTSVRIPRSEIVSTEILNTSMMPQGLDQLLSQQEMADLMAFILGQDQDPETDASILR